MARERASGWPWQAVLVAAVLFVAADFVRHPFTGGSVGRAAVPAPNVVLLAPVDDGAPVQALARSLSGPQSSARVARPHGGAAATVLAFARRRERDGGRLLVLTSAMLAEIERGRRQPLTSDERAAAEAALRALDTLEPVAPLLAERELIAVRARDRMRSFAALRTALRADPGARVFGIGADAASKARLAGVLRSLGVSGDVPYRIFPTGADAALALASGEVDVVLCARSQTLAEARRGSVRVLAGDVGRTWSMVVGPPALDTRVRRQIARRIDAARERTPWRRYVRQHRLRALRPGAAGLTRFLARERVSAARSARIAARVPERPRAGD